MKSNRLPELIDCDLHDRDADHTRALAILLSENQRLKKLIVQLSETVVRNVLTKSK
jgi:hypothetical protein